MNILLCTNSFENVVNGPAKFANLILEVNNIPNYHLRILTEDVQHSTELVHKVSIEIPRPFRAFSQFYRMFKYHLAAIEISRQFQIDIIVYNNSLVGLISAIWFKGSVGMINDDNNSSVSILNPELNYSFVKKIIFKQFEKLSVFAHNKIITNSDYLLRQISEAYKPSSHKLHKLYKAIELPGSVLITRGKLKNPIRILFVKADFIRGGVSDLATALSLLNYEFVCIVIGPEPIYRSRVEQFFKNAENVEVEFLGPQSQIQVREEMLKADIFCTPARQEALGVSNLEAISLGLPVVGTMAGGIPEILDHGRNGWLADPGDPLSLAEQIKRCIQNDVERSKKCNAGIAYSQKFNKEIMIDRFLRILEADS